MKSSVTALAPLIEATARNFSLLVEFRDDLLKPEAIQAAENDDAVFKANLSLAITEFGVPQSELARRLNTSDSNVSRWVRGVGKNYPRERERSDILQKIADILTEHIDAELKRKAENDAAGKPTFLKGKVRRTR